MADIIDMHCVQTELYRIADVERAVSDKLYPAKTIYIQISACRRANLEQFFMTGSDGTLDSKYAVILPKTEVIPEYLLTALNQAAPEFMTKYVGTNINIQIDAFKWFRLGFHPDLQAQKIICEFLKPMEEQIKRVEESIEAVQRLKEFYLETMVNTFI